MFEPSNYANDLLNLGAMRSLCKYQEELMSQKLQKKKTCEIQSLVTFITHRTGVQKLCKDINQEDIDLLKNLIKTCARFAVHKEANYSSYPDLCTAHNRLKVHLILNDLAQIGFYDEKTDTIGKLTRTALIMQGSSTMYGSEFYKTHMIGTHIGDDEVRLTAVRFEDQVGVMDTLVNEYIFSDLRYFGVACGLVFLIMLVYLRSFVLMMTTLLNIMVSFSTAYFLFHFVLRLKFWPYMNFLAGLALIAVGADDMFIFCDSFEQAKEEEPTSATRRWIEKTINHAAMSVFVASFTTSSAFFACAQSEIQTIKAFSIFCGISILANLFYMFTLTPATLVCIEYVSKRYKPSSGHFEAINKKVGEMMSVPQHFNKLLFQHLIPAFIGKTWFLWIFLLLSLGIGACIVVFVHPTLKLPETDQLQLFSKTNLLQNWASKKHTMFPKYIKEGREQQFSLDIFFGIHAMDPGDWFNPDDRGRWGFYVRDEKFDLNADTEIFLNDLCHDILKDPLLRPDKTICYFDAVVKVMHSYCNQPAMIQSKAGECCPDDSSIPLKKNGKRILKKCAPLYDLILYFQVFNIAGNLLNIVNVLGDIIYNSTTLEPEFYRFHLETNTSYTEKYEILSDLHTKTVHFLNSRIFHSSAPEGVQSAYVSYFGKSFLFYDLQRALAIGTFYSIGLSLSVAFGVMLLTSRDLLITIYAMITISQAIVCTVAVLVFLDWHLSIVESVIISLAVGLSIDFTIHFGIAFRLSRSAMSSERTADAFRKVGSAVAMAALTTFVAGLAMMPCIVNMYIKLGIFLMLVITFSWLYATLFFLSVCHIIGPSEQCYGTFFHIFRTQRPVTLKETTGARYEEQPSSSRT